MSFGLRLMIFMNMLMVIYVVSMLVVSLKVYYDQKLPSFYEAYDDEIQKFSQKLNLIIQKIPHSKSLNWDLSDQPEEFTQKYSLQRPPQKKELFIAKNKGKLSIFGHSWVNSNLIEPAKEIQRIIQEYAQRYPGGVFLKTGEGVTWDVNFKSNGGLSFDKDMIALEKEAFSEIIKSQISSGLITLKDKYLLGYRQIPQTNLILYVVLPLSYALKPIMYFGISLGGFSILMLILGIVIFLMVYQKLMKPLKEIGILSQKIAESDFLEKKELSNVQKDEFYNIFKGLYSFSDLIKKEQSKQITVNQFFQEMIETVRGWMEFPERLPESKDQVLSELIKKFDMVWEETDPIKIFIEKNFFDAYEIALNKKNALELMTKNALEQDEIQKGRLIQKMMLPQSTENEGVIINYHYQPAEHLSGDILGFQNKELWTYFFLGDVNGHSIGSSLVGGVMLGAWQAFILFLEDAGDLSLVAQRVNQTICHFSKGKLMMTLFLGSLNKETGEVITVNCGHKPLIWIHDNKCSSISQTNDLIGSDILAQYPVKIFQVNRGDCLFMMSDGLVENKSSDGKSLSDKKLRQIIVKKNLELLMQEAEKIWHQTPAQDDVTALLLEWV